MAGDDPYGMTVADQPNGGDPDGGRRTRLNVASVYLEDAINHRHTDFIPTEYHARLYTWYKKPYFVFLLYLSYGVLMALALFEKPAMKGLKLPFWATVTVEFFCVAFFVFRFCHEMCFSKLRTFWHDTKHITCCTILVLTVVDIVIYTIVVETAGEEHPYAVRWSRALRPFLIVNFPEPRQVRRAFRNIRNTLPDILNVMVLLLASVSIFTLMALKLFGSKQLVNTDGSPYFDDFGDAFWDLWVLITTANNPDIMMPAYDKHRAYTCYFIAFLVVNLYMFMSVFLAVIYNTYKNRLEKVVRESVYHKRELLAEAYHLIKEEGGGIEKDAFLEVMRRSMPKHKPDYFAAIWLILDPENRGSISCHEFFKVVELINFKFTDISDERTLFERLTPRLYHSRVSKVLNKCVKHVAFRYFFDFIIVLNAVCMAFDFTGAEWFFLALFTLEILLKLYTFGPHAFFRKLWNIFDVIIVGSALVVSVLELILEGAVDSVSSLDVLLVLRAIRVFKIFQSVPRFRIIVNTMLHILPSVATYGTILVFFYYFFAIIGMETFAGLIRFTGYNSTDEPFCGNAKLEGSRFYQEHYCSNNFNDIASSFVTLFELMVVNQWHVITEGHVLVTSKAARLFFITFYFTCVLIVLNIFTAFVIEAFCLEYALRSTKKPVSTLVSRINQMGLGYGSKPVKVRKKHDSDGQTDFLVPDEDDVDADHGTMQLELEEDPDSMAIVSSQTKFRFHLEKRSKTVQGLLEKMFESQLKAESSVEETYR